MTWKSTGDTGSSRAESMWPVILLFLLVLLSGCGGDQDGTNAGIAQTAATIAKSPAADSTEPVVAGNWYQPPVGVTWQWQLIGDVNTSYPVDIYDIDLFASPESLIDSLHSTGRKVVCYFSAGSHESWRPDASEFLPADLGNTMEGWEDERWLDIRSSNVCRIMQQRLDLARLKGCDAVEPDNIDGYANDSGFDLTAADQLAFNRFIAEEAHKRDLSVGLKNDLYQADQLVDLFDFSVNEQCHQYDECELLTPFIAAGKPVLNAEYDQVLISNEAKRQSLCSEAIAAGFSTLFLPLELDDSFRLSCSS